MKSKDRQYKLNQCDKGWFTLKKIEGETEKRYCDTCDKSVHWCNTEADLQEAVSKQWCVAAENRLIYSDSTRDNVNSVITEGYYVGGLEPNYLVPKKID